MDGLYSSQIINEIVQRNSEMMANYDSPVAHMWADEQFEILKKHIQLFESELDSTQEVGIMMTNFGQSVLMQVTEITFEYPVLMIFKGNVNGRKATLIQHINQLNFMLTAMELSDGKKRRPIGFTVDAEK